MSIISRSLPNNKINKIVFAIHNIIVTTSSMEEVFILLSRAYGFWGVPPPFDTLKKCTFAYDMNLKLYR